MNLNDPIDVALELARIFDQSGFVHALYGGLLLASYGEARETLDTDIAAVGHVERALQLVERAGLRSQLEFDSLQLGGLRVSRLALLGRPGDSGLGSLDLVRPISDRYAELSLARRLHTELRGSEIDVLMPEDFVLYKLLSSRDRDLRDAASVLKRLRSDIERDLITEEVTRLESESGGHPVAARWAEIRPN